MIGVYPLFSDTLSWLLIFPAITIGFLSTSVLNLNNMRDRENDEKVGKRTLVVKLGASNAKRYHFFLIIGAMVSVLVFAILSGFRFDQYLFLLAYIPLTKHLFTVSKNQDPKLLDPELKKVALSTFLLSILLSICMISLISDIIVNVFLGGR